MPSEADDTDPRPENRTRLEATIPTPPQAERMTEWRTWTDDGSYRTFATLRDAERSAKARARAGVRVEITRDGRTVAYVRTDALDRVWVDVVDASVA